MERHRDVTTPIEPLCDACSRLRDADSHPTCEAFPDGIPDAIYFEAFDHRDPFPGDNGVRFVPSGEALDLVDLYDSLSAS